MELLNQNKMEVQAIKHTDVRGKEQFYLKIKNATQEYLISVGKTTYEKVTEMSQQTELKLEENENRNTVDNQNNSGGHRNRGNTSNK